jgi:hypothetical protein
LGLCRCFFHESRHSQTREMKISKSIQLGRDEKKELRLCFFHSGNWTYHSRIDDRFWLIWFDWHSFERHNMSIEQSESGMLYDNAFCK